MGNDREIMGLKLLQKALAVHKGLETGCPDPDTAFRWYLKAARMGCLPAMKHLGLACLEKQDYENAYYWFLEAALGGEKDSLYYIGDLYYKGIYVRRDPEKAYAFFRRAYKKGVNESCYYMGLEAETGEPGELAPDMEKAVSIYRKGTAEGSAASALRLGRCFMAGTGVPQDREQGREYILLSYRWGSPEACGELGRIYETGDGTEPDMQKAGQYYTEGVRRGNSGCKAALQRLKEKGEYQDGR